jgi:hypothetical protein
LWIQKLFYAEVKIQRFFYKRWIHVDSCWSRLYNHGESVLKQFFFPVWKTWEWTGRSTCHKNLSAWAVTAFI